MREIKFRAWEEFTGTMLHWEDLMSDALEIREIFTPRESALTMQYTGVKDKNGVEIYEGDVVRSKDYSHGAIFPNQPQKNVVVKWWTSGALWSYGKTGYFHIEEDFEIIGNIYENPKLLEESK